MKFKYLDKVTIRDDCFGGFYAGHVGVVVNCKYGASYSCDPISYRVAFPAGDPVIFFEDKLEPALEKTHE